MKSMSCSFFWISDTMCSLGLIRIVFQKSDGSCSTLELCRCTIQVNNASLEFNLQMLKISLWFPVVSHIYDQELSRLKISSIYGCVLDSIFKPSMISIVNVQIRSEKLHVQYHSLFVQITLCTATSGTITTIFWSLHYIPQLLKLISVAFMCIYFRNRGDFLSIAPHSVTNIYVSFSTGRTAAVCTQTFDGFGSCHCAIIEVNIISMPLVFCLIKLDSIIFTVLFFQLLSVIIFACLEGISTTCLWFDRGGGNPQTYSFWELLAT